MLSLWCGNTGLRPGPVATERLGSYVEVVVFPLAGSANKADWAGLHFTSIATEQPTPRCIFDVMFYWKLGRNVDWLRPSSFQK